MDASMNPDLGPVQGQFFAKAIERFGSADSAVAAMRQQFLIQPLPVGLDLQVFLNVMGREDEAFEVSQELVRLVPDEPRVLFNQAIHWLKRKNLHRGLGLLEWGRGLKNYGNEAIPSNQPLWAKATGYGQHVILALEGGFGDEILCLRFGEKLVRDYHCRVSLVCSPGIASVFGRVPWVAAVMQKEAAPGVFHESWLPGMSAGFALGLEYGDLSGQAYLTADPEYQKKWSEKLAQVEASNQLTPSEAATQPLRVGLRWSGQPHFAHQQLRSIPPSVLLSLREQLSQAGTLSGGRRVQFYSFQRDHDLVSLPDGVVDLQGELTNWEETTAALSHMDLVISSCTSIAHMSAALGRPTWVLVPTMPYYCWSLSGDRTPWYDSVRLIRQKTYSNWETVQDELHLRFKEWLAGL